MKALIHISQDLTGPSQGIRESREIKSRDVAEFAACVVAANKRRRMQLEFSTTWSFLYYLEILLSNPQRHDYSNNSREYKQGIRCMKTFDISPSDYLPHLAREAPDIFQRFHRSLGNLRRSASSKYALEYVLHCHLQDHQDWLRESVAEWSGTEHCVHSIQRQHQYSHKDNTRYLQLPCLLSQHWLQARYTERHEQDRCRSLQGKETVSANWRSTHANRQAIATKRWKSIFQR